MKSALKSEPSLSLPGWLRVMAVLTGTLGSLYGQSFSACGVNICAPYGTWLGLGTSAPNGNLVVVEGSLSDSYANGGVGGLRLATGSGQVTDESLIFGVHNGDYSWIQAVEPGSTDRNLLLNPNGGNVGIGTASPQYELSVNGTIQAKEVMVNTGWSDYVFDPDYRLASLDEISGYIKANHHLPDIPSASEVEQKGISLGEMQSKMLAKIEELTLHMIAAEERNGRLEEQNKELVKKIARMEVGAGKWESQTAPAPKTGSR